MKVAINSCYGGFSLSKAAVLWLAEHGQAAAREEVAKREAEAKTPRRDDVASNWSRDRWAAGDEVEGWGGYSWSPWEDGALSRHDPY